MNTPVANADAINELLARYGVKFGIYKNGNFNEQLFDKLAGALCSAPVFMFLQRFGEQLCQANLMACYLQ